MINIKKIKDPFRVVNEKYKESYKEFFIGLLPTMFLEENTKVDVKTAKLPIEKWGLICDWIFCWYVQTPITIENS